MNQQEKDLRAKALKSWETAQLADAELRIGTTYRVNKGKAEFVIPTNPDFSYFRFIAVNTADENEKVSISARRLLRKTVRADVDGPRLNLFGLTPKWHKNEDSVELDENVEFTCTGELLDAFDTERKMVGVKP